ncbi:MAG: chorismate synthase [Planctomycetota bacterium]|nr:MAG: chorismate synthase [Planctomycetota bacterium]
MLRRLGVQTAGESHGRGVFATLTGLPAGVPLDLDAVNARLALRQAGFGRSSRQQLEHDQLDVLAGVHKGRSTGAPLLLAVWNRDDSLPDKPSLHRPRPGHADLAGGQKYDQADMRPVLERASARETAARVAAAGVVASLLDPLGIDVLGYVSALAGQAAKPPSVRAGLPGLRRRRDRSSFHCVDSAVEASWKRHVTAARKAGDTLGGVVEVQARGVPPGLGSLQGFETRLDARVGAAMLSIQAFKAVELGEGLEAAALPGSQVHDAVGRPGPEGPKRPSNRAGGLEGGMSNGEALLVRGFMKPLATLRQPLPSWDFTAKRPDQAHFERSDVTAVPSAAIVAEAMVLLVVADALLEKTGGDTLSEVRRALTAHRRVVARRFGTGGAAKRS